MKELNDALEAADIASCAAILRSIPPKQHTALAKAIEEHFDELKKTRHTNWKLRNQPRENLEGEPRDTAAEKAEDQLLDEQERRLHLARLFAYQERKKLPSTYGLVMEDLLVDEVFESLIKAKPEWLAGLVAVSNWDGRFEVASKLAQRYFWSGAITRPPGESIYYECVTLWINVACEGDIERAKELLRKHPELIEHDLLQSVIQYSQRQREWSVIKPWNQWKNRGEFGLFGSGDHMSRDSKADMSLAMLVSQVCMEGHSSLRPLLKATLEGLLDDEESELLTLYLAFAPPPGLAVEFQQMAFTLLGVLNKMTVRFALQMIDSFRHLPEFDAPGFISSVAPVFQLDSNPLSIQAVKLIGAVLKNHPEISGEIVNTTPAALLGGNDKVQIALAKLLASLPASCSASIPEAIEPFSASILPSVRPMFSAWLGNREAVEVSSSPPKTISRELGNPLLPLGSLEDLAFTANALLDRDFDPLRLELFLDGLSKFAAADLNALERAFAPLQKRALKIDERTKIDHERYAIGQLFVVHLLLEFGGNPPEGASWIPDPGFPHETNCSSGMLFAGNRIREVLNSVRDGHAAPLLATPEFHLGFISAVTLLQRFNAMINAGTPLGHYDFIQAIARCDMDSWNPSAAAILPEPDSEASRVLRFLFLNEIVGEIDTPVWWMTAARTRDPLGDFSNHSRLGQYVAKNQADWTRPPICIRPDHENFESSFAESEWRYLKSIPADRIYPLAHHFPLCGDDARRGADFTWLCSFLPSLLDGVVAGALDFTLHDYSRGSKIGSHLATVVLVEFSRRRLPLRDAMQVHMLMALVGPSAEPREVAIELFVQASDDGRLATAVEGFGQNLAAIFRSKSRLINKHFDCLLFVGALRKLAVSSPLLQRQVRDILLVALEAPLEEIPRGFSSLLEVLHELIISHPLEARLDLNEKWDGLLTGNAKSIAAKIARLPIV
jgi:hypothetical protein